MALGEAAPSEAASRERDAKRVAPTGGSRAARGGAIGYGRIVERFTAWRLRKIASPAFQAWASRFPLTRPRARRDAQRLYDLVAGFVYSQTLLACVELGLLRRLRGGPQSTEALSRALDLPPERVARLAQAAAAIGLLVRERDGRYRLGDLGAAALGAPGLEAMIRHHAVFYRDLADPVALLRGETEPQLAHYWSYVRGGGDHVSDEDARIYSELMASSQRHVAEETLSAVSLRGRRRLLDVGGGAGVFLAEAARLWPRLELALFDLPPVAAEAARRLDALGLSDRIAAHGGSFMTDPLPPGADAVSLVRVLYDHDDPVAEALLAKVFDYLPSGGLLLISEPMSGGARPSRAGDAYFGFYTLAMTSGRPRSAERFFELLAQAGFHQARRRRTRRPFLTSVVTARKP